MSNGENKVSPGGKRPKMTLAQVVSKYAPYLKPRVDSLQRIERLYKEIKDRSTPLPSKPVAKVVAKPNRCYDCGSKQVRTYNTDEEGWTFCECFPCRTEYVWHPVHGTQSIAGYNALGCRPTVSNSQNWASVVKSNKAPNKSSNDWRKDYNSLPKSGKRPTVNACQVSDELARLDKEMKDIQKKAPKLSKKKQMALAKIAAKEERAKKEAMAAKPITKLDSAPIMDKAKGGELEISELREDKPKRVNGEIITEEALTASIDQVMKSVDVSSDLPTYEQYMKDFRKESRSQPGQVSKWIKSAKAVIESWPTRLIACTPMGVYRIKRDLSTNKHYLLNYFHLVESLELPDLDLTDREKQISAAAMMVALKPLMDSWKKKKSGGTSQRSQSLRASSTKRGGI